jgi:pantetheine-phosphate adenylyltransferase
MRIAIYAGTFDPITRGHLSVIERASYLFDRTLVLIATNPAKQPLFSAEERLDMLRETTAAYNNVGCALTHGYVVEFAREQGAKYLIRGVRSSTDVESELTLANLNHQLAPEIATVFVPAHPNLSEVSSSRLKSLAAAGADISQYCSASVITRLNQKLGRAHKEDDAHAEL